jgi:hypothetical protein
MKPSVIVWDLETVPDFVGFAAANQPTGEAIEYRPLGHDFSCVTDLAQQRWRALAAAAWSRISRPRRGRNQSDN